MPTPVGVGVKRGGLADVVEQRGPTGDPRLRCALDDPGSVLPHVVDVVGRVLVEALACRDFGHDRYEHVDGFHQRVMRVVAEQQSIEFVRDAFGRDAQQARLFLLHGGERDRFDRETELRGEPAPAQHAQPVFCEALLGVADHAQRSRFEVFHARPAVEQSALGVIGHGVHREVAAREVLFD